MMKFHSDFEEIALTLDSDGLVVAVGEKLIQVDFSRQEKHELAMHLLRSLEDAEKKD